MFSPSRRSLVDLALVWGGSLVSACSGIGAQVVLARLLGPADYGLLASALGLMAMLAAIAVFGVFQFWLRAFGEEGWAAVRWLKPAFTFLITTICFILVILFLYGHAFVTVSRDQFVYALLSAVLLSVVASELASTKYQLEQDYSRFSAVGAIVPVLRLIVAFILYLSPEVADKLKFAVIGYAIASLISVVILLPSICAVWRRQIKLSGHGPRKRYGDEVTPSVTRLVSQTWVFGVAGFLYLAWAQGHIVAANQLLGNQSAGFYGAALVLLNAVCLLPTVAFSKYLLPKIHRWAVHDFSKLRAISRYLSGIMLGAGIVSAMALYGLSDWLVGGIFGVGYDTSAEVLKVLALTLPMRFLGYNAGAMLRTNRFMKIKVVLLVLAVAVNVMLIAILVPIWGLIGLACTVVITEFLLVVAYVFQVERRYFQEYS